VLLRYMVDANRFRSSLGVHANPFDGDSSSRWMPRRRKQCLSRRVSFYQCGLDFFLRVRFEAAVGPMNCGLSRQGEPSGCAHELEELLGPAPDPSGVRQNISKYSRCSQSETSAWKRSISAFLMWT
jgi:hypothetical protein